MRLRVLSYNVHKCTGGVDRRYDPARTCAAIAHHEPDVVLLQEVARGPKFGGDEQLERIGELLGLRHRVHFVNVRRRRLEYGNAILARFPLSREGNVDLRVPPYMARSVLHARCRVRLGASRTRTVHFFNLHIGLLESERREQLGRFLASQPFRGLHERTPLVLGGDFNDVWGNAADLLELHGFRGPRRRPPTFPAFAAVRALDAIHVRGDALLEHVAASRAAGARQASDHLPLVADLRLTSGRRAGSDGPRNAPWPAAREG